MNRIESDFCVMGGGIAGLCVARELAKRRATVTIVERGRIGEGAGRAAAGMLAPIVEAHLEERGVLEFNLEALSFYSGFVAELQDETGIDVDLRRDGTLIVAVDRDHAEWLRHRFREYMRLDLEVDWLSGYEVRQVEPYLAPGVHGALVSTSDQQVDNRRLLNALAEFVRANENIRVLEESGEGELVVEGDRAVATVCDGARVEAGAFISATGAHTGYLRAVAPDIARAIRPVKGQIIRLDQSRNPVLERLLRTPDVYLAPKSDGTLVVGASSEEKGFDDTLTAGEIYQLLRRAWEVLPATYELPVREFTVGFRPAAIDHAPILGATRIQGLFMASGYFRHGILMSPYGASLLAGSLMNEEPSRWLETFSIERLHADRIERAFC